MVFIDYIGVFYDNICRSVCDICVGCRVIVWRVVGRRVGNLEYRKVCRCKFYKRYDYMLKYIRSRKRLGELYLVYNFVIGDDFSWLENEK